MSFIIGLNTGLRALSAARYALEITGHNVANSSTPGYSRQLASLSAARPYGIGRGMQLGTGVRLTGIERSVSELLDARIRGQQSLYGLSLSQSDGFAELEGVVSQGDGSGLEGLLPGFFEAVSQLKADPRAPGLRGNVVTAGRGLAEEFRLVSSRLSELRGANADEVEGVLGEINRKAEAIAHLNDTIVQVEFQGQQANDLRDQRELLLKELSGLVSVRAFERQSGSVDVLVEGRLLVAHKDVNPLTVEKSAGGGVRVLLAGSSAPLQAVSGKLGALVEAANAAMPDLAGKLDALAGSLIRDVNRIHSTGIPRSGSFQSLVAEYAITDGNGNGQFTDELLADSRLPFPIQKGTLWLSVSNRTTGEIERTRIAIDPEAMTIGDLASRLGAAGHLSAVVDTTGRLRITADDGYAFDFSPRLDSSPDPFGSFGGTNAAMAGANGGPYSFTVPASFTVQVDGGAAQTVTFTGTTFQNAAAATAAEVVDALNAQLTGATAREVGGRVVLRSDTGGAASSLQLLDGANTPLALLGFTTGQTINGSGLGVAVSVSGRYTGTANDQFRFVVDGNGQVGVTQGLTVSVFNQSGARVAQLAVGRGYSPGDRLQVADGVHVTFGPGTLSADANHQFALDVLADSDTSDALVALGLNILFKGSTAGDIAINQAIDQNPDLLAAGLSGTAGDGDNLTRLLDLRGLGLDGLSGRTLEDFEGRMIADLGFDVARSREVAAAQESTLSLLEQQRDQISGVSVDEEVINLTRYQQAFEASSRFLTTVNQLMQTLLDIGR